MGPVCFIGDSGRTVFVRDLEQEETGFLTTPLGLTDHQWRHLLRTDLSPERIHTASAARIPANRK